jgi:hypothetical protein
MAIQHHARGAPIEVSTYLPGVLRIALAVIGAGVCILLVWELWRGLWPPNVFSLFFAVIVFGGVSVGLTFVAGAVLAPNVRWKFTRGAVTVEAELNGENETHTFTRRSFSEVKIVEVSNDSGPDTFRLDCTLMDPTQAGRLFGRHRSRLATLMFIVSPFRSARYRDLVLRSLRSPEFKTREDAKAALALLES